MCVLCSQCSWNRFNTLQSELSQGNYIRATWKLRYDKLNKSCELCFVLMMFMSLELCFRTYLKLPWRPLISIDGSTVYELDRDFKVRKDTKTFALYNHKIILSEYWFLCSRLWNMLRAGVSLRLKQSGKYSPSTLSPLVAKSLKH